MLSKSCKVIPVMLMGKLVSRNKYEPYEYGTALLISVGMMMFMFGSHDQPESTCDNYSLIFLSILLILLS